MRRLRFPRVLLVLGLLAAFSIGALVAASKSAASMATSAGAFLGALTPEQRQLAALPLEGDELTRFNFIPTEMFPRKGVAIKNMTEPQRKLAHDLLKSGLSQRGYLTASSIMELEGLLRDIESAAGTRKFARDPQEYYFTVFGTPAAKGAWGWRVEGHHVSLHFSITDGAAVASSPTFFGTNPAEVREGPRKGWRILGAQEDAGRALVLALDDAQKTTAIIQAAAPTEIITNNVVKAEALSPVGIAASAMKPAQRELLTKLIDVYVSYMPDDLASERLAKLRQAGLDKITFAWAGDTALGQKNYYRVQGPTFLIEYDNTQNNGNHVHSVWRDFNGDFGRDLIKEHLAAVAH